MMMMTSMTNVSLCHEAQQVDEELKECKIRILIITKIIIIPINNSGNYESVVSVHF